LHVSQPTHEADEFTMAINFRKGKDVSLETRSFLTQGMAKSIFGGAARLHWRHVTGLANCTCF
jgi:Fe-S cluster biosynthesis and repair protein YggX